jgi:hypothetical protein
LLPPVTVTTGVLAGESLHFAGITHKGDARQSP